MLWEIFHKPEDEVMIHRDRLAAPERPQPLAYTAPVWHISSFGIEPLSWTVVIKQPDRGARLRGASSDQALSCLHQAGRDAAMLIAWKDTQMMNQGYIALPEQRVL